MTPEDTLYRLIGNALICCPVAHIGPEDTVAQRLADGCDVWSQPGLHSGSAVRAQTRPAQFPDQNGLHLLALQVPYQGQGQRTVWRLDRDAEDIATDDSKNATAIC